MPHGSRGPSWQCFPHESSKRPQALYHVTQVGLRPYRRSCFVRLATRLCAILPSSTVLHACNRSGASRVACTSSSTYGCYSPAIVAYIASSRPVLEFSLRSRASQLLRLSWREHVDFHLARATNTTRSSESATFSILHYARFRHKYISQDEHGKSTSRDA